MADLPPIEHRWLEYCYTKLGRSTGRSHPPIKHRCLEYTTPNVADLTADLPPVN